MTSMHMLILNAVDRGVETLLGQAEDYKICICCFFVKHAVFRSKSRDWLYQSQVNVFK
jgi:hypothetical protein